MRKLILHAPSELLGCEESRQRVGLTYSNQLRLMKKVTQSTLLDNFLFERNAVISTLSGLSIKQKNRLPAPRLWKKTPRNHVSQRYIPSTFSFAALIRCPSKKNTAVKINSLAGSRMRVAQSVKSIWNLGGEFVFQGFGHKKKAGKLKKIWWALENEHFSFQVMGSFRRNIKICSIKLQEL